MRVLGKSRGRRLCDGGIKGYARVITFRALDSKLMWAAVTRKVRIDDDSFFREPCHPPPVFM